MLLEEFISEKKLSKIIIAASDLNKKLSKVKRLVWRIKFAWLWRLYLLLKETCNLPWEKEVNKILCLVKVYKTWNEEQGSFIPQGRILNTDISPHDKQYIVPDSIDMLP